MKDHLAILSFIVIAVLCGYSEAQSTCAQANRKPKLRESKESGIMSMFDCEALCTVSEDCIYFHWRTKGTCYLWDLTYKDDKRGGGAGKKNCDCTPAPALSCKCGLANRLTATSIQYKIVGGQETKTNEYPWQVALVVEAEDGYLDYFCGGSLISDQWVLTAANCFEDGALPEDYQVILGMHQMSDDSEPTLYVDVEIIVPHPNYEVIEDESFIYDNFDFALLKLASQVDLKANPSIKPVCLPTSVSKDYAKDLAIATGWGVTEEDGDILSDTLQEVEVEVLSNKDCRKNTGYGNHITANMVCAGDLTLGGVDACQGDSGGPLISSGDGDGVTEGQNYEIIGVNSFGLGCARPGFPGVYARVSTVLDWIKETVFDTGSLTCPRILLNLKH